MKRVNTELDGVFILEPRVFEDDRGFFYESFNAETFFKLTGLKTNFVQDNHSRSQRGVLRGLHYQIQKAQGKLVRATQGEIFDVAVDIRRSSKNFGRWVGVTLSSANRRQLYVPEGFAHGFLVVSETAEVQYKTTDYYSPADERCIRWDDPALGISWPLKGLTPSVSTKDEKGLTLATAEVF